MKQYVTYFISNMPHLDEICTSTIIIVLRKNIYQKRSYKIILVFSKDELIVKYNYIFKEISSVLRSQKDEFKIKKRVNFSFSKDELMFLILNFKKKTNIENEFGF